MGGTSVSDVTILWAVILSLSCFSAGVRGHGRLVEPPARASMWRYGYDTPINYSDNELSCGGYFALWRKYHGKCGVCGDEWDAPRDNEAGGLYASGIITRHYYPGEIITVKVEITAFHSGWIEFRLCENNDVNIPATEECFQKHSLLFTEGYGTRYEFKSGEDKGMYTFSMRLPHEVTCQQCILRWRYHTGNSWGVGDDGIGCMGCGQQEEFYGCSDISVTYNVQTPSYKQRNDVINFISQNRLRQSVSEVQPWFDRTPRKHYIYKPFTTTLKTTTRTTPAPTLPPTTLPPTTTPAPTLPPTTTADPNNIFSSCHAIGLWRGSDSFDVWCVDNCGSGYCPSSFCRC